MGNSSPASHTQANDDNVQGLPGFPLFGGVHSQIIVGEFAFFKLLHKRESWTSTSFCTPKTSKAIAYEPRLQWKKVPEEHSRV
jgi:hypothetical protein